MNERIIKIMRFKKGDLMVLKASRVTDKIMCIVSFHLKVHMKLIIIKEK